jgi:hypothetical protein
MPELVRLRQEYHQFQASLDYTMQGDSVSERKENKGRKDGRKEGKEGEKEAGREEGRKEGGREGRKEGRKERREEGGREEKIADMALGAVGILTYSPGHLSRALY